MKQEILISLIYESNFFADGKLQQPNKENQRIRDFILEKQEQAKVILLSLVIFIKFYQRL